MGKVMLIRILESNAYFEKGIKKVPYEVALDLIAKGIAMKVSENALDKQAHDSLDDAKARDQFSGGD
jgi:hypothetical protein